MDFTEKDVKTWNRLKEKGCFYVQVPGLGGWKSSGKTTRPEAVACALLFARGGLAPNMTVLEFCAGFFVPGRWGYIDGHPNRSPDYWRALQTEVDLYIIPRWGSSVMNDVKPSSFHSWLSGLMSARSIDRAMPRPLSARSKLSILSTTNVIWNWAVFKEVLPANTLSTIPKPERDETKRRSFKLAELLKMFPDNLQSVWPQPWGLFFFLAAETGCRPQEVAGLDVADFLPDRRAYIVRQAADRHNGLKELKTARTGVEKKAIRLSARLTDLLQAYLAGRTEGLLFHREEGLPLRVDTANDTFQRVLDGLKGFVRAGRTPYCLRHTANTKMRTELGDDLTRALMGHLTPAMTRRYDDPDEEDLLARIGR